MIEQYLNTICYRWKKYSEFHKNGVRWVIVSEFSHSGEESEWYALGERDGDVFNKNGYTVFREGIVV